MRAWLREEFTGGGWRWYLVGGVPLATLTAALTPAAFDPFAVAAFLFPLFFYFIRRGRLAAALWSGFGWVAAHGLLVALLIGWDRSAYLPLFTMPVDFGWRGVSVTDTALVAAAVGKGVADYLFTLLLSAISGGALALVAAAAGGSEAGIALGGLLSTAGGGAGLEAAFLSVRPWALMTFVGNLMGAVAAASWFTAKLEKRPINPIPLIRYALLGFSFVAFALYLQFSLGPTWEEAYRSALSVLSAH